MKARINHERNKLLQSIEELLEGPMIVLGFTWLILLVVELIWGLPKYLEYVSMAIWVLFIFDFLVKFFLAPSKKRYLRNNWLTAISLLIPAIRVVRFVRFLRIMKGIRGVRVIKIVSSLNRGMRSLAATMKRRAFGYVMILTIVVTFAGAAGMYSMEKGTPGFRITGWLSGGPPCV